MILNRYTKMAVFTADDEEPECMCCDNIYSSCCNSCGPEHFWAGYRRSIQIKEMLMKLADRINRESNKKDD